MSILAMLTPHGLATSEAKLPEPIVHREKVAIPYPAKKKEGDNKWHN